MATPRKSTQRSTSAKRRPPAKSSTRASRNGQSESTGTRRAAPKSLRMIAVTAARELSELIGQVPEGIVGVERDEDGWRVQVEVVESRRIPETTDILAVYEVDVDSDGDVTGYRRLKRYVRGQTEE
jgi:Gas vesicle synthesis protein GvpO